MDFFLTSLFWRLQKAIVKTSFFDGKSLPSTMTSQISTHLWRKNESVEMPIIFVENVIFFGGKYSCLIFYDGIKMFVASKVLFMPIEEKPSELLTPVMALVHWKYKIYIFYGVSICDKQSSIVNIKVGIIYDDRKNTVDTINTYDGLCASKIQKIYFLWCYYLQQTLFHRI